MASLSPFDIPGKEVGDTVLYYGCRHEKEDYLYQEELAKFVADGTLTQLNVAFSRDQERKVTPQDGQAPKPPVGGQHHLQGGL